MELHESSWHYSNLLCQPNPNGNSNQIGTVYCIMQTMLTPSYLFHSKSTELPRVVRFTIAVDGRRGGLKSLWAWNAMGMHLGFKHLCFLVVDPKKKQLTISWVNIWWDPIIFGESSFFVDMKINPPLNKILLAEVDILQLFNLSSF